jgi:hypothetical protein
LYATDEIDLDKAATQPELQAHAMMFAMGVAYQIKTLQDYAVHEYSSRILTSSFLEYTDSISTVYHTSSPNCRALRDVVVDYGRMKVKEAGIPLERIVWISDVCRYCPEFMSDLWQTQ